MRQSLEFVQDWQGMRIRLFEFCDLLLLLQQIRAKLEYLQVIVWPSNRYPNHFRLESDRIARVVTCSWTKGSLPQTWRVGDQTLMSLASCFGLEEYVSYRL